jgi:NADH-quinone oxidoreductase subunit A
MNNPGEQITLLWPIVVFFAAVLLVVAGMIVLSYFSGERHKDKEADEPYESGIIATGAAHVRFDVRFYMIAMFFVVFDLEAVFIFSWAIAARELGWGGYLEIVIFIVVLIFVLIYLWRIGALEWGSVKQKSAVKLRRQ